MEEYYSQDGQDQYLDKKLFRRKTKGFFVEIGANDGVTFSNTYFLEKYRDWDGICVEPHPTAFERLRKNRKAKLINACISASENDNEFMRIEGYGEMYSGLTSKYHENLIKRIERDLLAHGGTQEKIKVPGLRLDSILNQNKISHVDYCSIDTEGGELEILQTINLKEYEIEVISVENNYYEEALGKFMKDLDYKPLSKIGADEFYRKRKSSIWFFDW